MAVATPHVGTLAKVTFTPSGGSIVTLKNSDWTLTEEPNIKTSSNTTDGIVRAAGLADVSGTVKGTLDESQPVEADITPGTVGVLKLYRNATKFFQVTAIIGKLSIEIGTENMETWDFDWSLQSGTVTEPV